MEARRSKRQSHSTAPSCRPPPDVPRQDRNGLQGLEGRLPEPLRAPKGAPNVLLIMGDDIGYAHMSAFGGPANTPVFDRLAKQGLSFTNFHTTAVCSASRAALLTGRNAHSVGMGGVPETSIGFPGYNAMHPAQRRDRTRNPAAERLRHRLDRQDPPHAHARNHAPQDRSTGGRAAWAPNTSTASSAPA